MTTFYGLKLKEPIHFDQFEVAIVSDVKNIVAIDGSGNLVPGSDASAVRAIGFAYKSGIEVGQLQTVGKGLMAFQNDGTNAVLKEHIGLIGTVGEDGTNISVSAPGGTGVAFGRIKNIDAEGFVWVDTEDTSA